MSDRRSANEARATDGLRVLVVDDEHDNADTLAKLLILWGHDTRTAYDGATALATSSSFRPEVILADIGMPYIDGYSLAQQLRQRADLRSPTLIAISGFADEEHREQSIKAGYDLYLVKPANPPELQKLLASMREHSKTPAEENGVFLRRLQERLTQTAHLVQPAAKADTGTIDSC